MHESGGSISKQQQAASSSKQQAASSKQQQQQAAPLARHNPTQVLCEESSVPYVYTRSKVMRVMLMCVT
jgi:hypothetical protein